MSFSDENGLYYSSVTFDGNCIRIEMRYKPDWLSVLGVSSVQPGLSYHFCWYAIYGWSQFINIYIIIAITTIIIIIIISSSFSISIINCDWWMLLHRCQDAADVLQSVAALFSLAMHGRHSKFRSGSFWCIRQTLDAYTAASGRMRYVLTVRIIRVWPTCS